MFAFPDPKPFPVSGSTTVAGTSADDILAGYTGNDRVNGGSGDDIFLEGSHTFLATGGGFTMGVTYDLGQGNDTFDGGAGYDLLTVGGTTRAAVLNLSTGTLTRGTEVDTFFNVEDFDLGEGADKVIGTRNDMLLFTEGGNDTVVRLSTNSYLDGGAGFDLLDLRSLTAALTLNLSNGKLPQGSIAVNFEAVIGSATATNKLTGGTLGESLTGGALADSLYGGGGNDSLQGGAGNDSLDGGARQ